jgi:hypothetical protein
MFYLDTITIVGAITKLRDLDKVKMVQRTGTGQLAATVILNCSIQ